MQLNYTTHLNSAQEALEDELSRYNNQLIELMSKEKPYLQQQINLTSIADILDIPHTILSTVIHKKHNLGFNDFINKYRIEEVKKQLHNKDVDNLKITTIAYNCGFQSESTFFRVFKKLTGTTPNRYKDSLLKQRQNNH